MKFKLLVVILFLSMLSSCGVFIITNTPSSNIEVDRVEEKDINSKFLGDYEITAFNLPGYGDQTFKMTIKKNGDGLVSSFDSNGLSEFDILGTEVEDGVLYIDIYVEEFSLKTFFEIYVDGNNVTGYLADMFELEGTILK